MSVPRLEDLHFRFAQAFNSRDAEALIALYEPNATLVAQPGQSISGHEAIRAALGGFLALGGTMYLLNNPGRQG